MVTDRAHRSRGGIPKLSPQYQSCRHYGINAALPVGPWTQLHDVALVSKSDHPYFRLEDRKYSGLQGETYFLKRDNPLTFKERVSGAEGNNP